MSSGATMAPPRPLVFSVGAVLDSLARLMALTGGAGVLALIGMSLYSIVGRKLGSGGVEGDIELLEAGMAVSMAAFLPYCTLRGEHLKADFFTAGMNARWRAVLDGVAELVLSLVAGLLAWRTALAAMDLERSGDVTTLVSLPLWMPVSALVPGLALMACCALFRGVCFLSGRREVLP